jgi:ABC-type nitrate/sulfonate/bicarbonate transport system substrate-binding protein
MARMLAVVLAACALGLSGCAGEAHVDIDSSGTAHLGVSVLPIANVAPLYLGIRKGFVGPSTST